MKKTPHFQGDDPEAQTCSDAADMWIAELTRPGVREKLFYGDM